MTQTRLASLSQSDPVDCVVGPLRSHCDGSVKIHFDSQSFNRELELTDEVWKIVRPYGDFRTDLDGEDSRLD